MHQNGEGERREVDKKTFLRPFLKRKEVRRGLGSPRNFVAPTTSCSARIRMVRTQELPVAVYFGLRKKNDLRMYRAPRGGGGGGEREAFRIHNSF